MNKFSLQSKIIAIVLTLLSILIVSLSVIFFRMLSGTLTDLKGKQALSVAQSVSKMPAVIDAFSQNQPEVIIQPLVEEIRKETGATFIVVGNKDSVRYSHPMPERLGKKMVGGDNDRALINGESYVSHATGSLGPSVRGKVPIRNKQNEIIGVVSVGFLEDSIHDIVIPYRTKVLVLVTIILLIGIIGSFFIGKGIKKAIFGLEPKEIAMQFKEKRAIIESVREGIIAIDQHGSITEINAKAHSILALHHQHSYRGRHILDVIPETKMMDVLETRESQLDDEISLNHHDLIVNRLPIFEAEKIVGVVASFRRKDEIDQLTKELSQVQEYAGILRSQTHEYRNKLNTIAGLIQLHHHEEALTLIQEESSGYEDLIQFLLRAVPDPVLAGLIIGKYNRSQELKVSFSIHPDSSITTPLTDIQREKLITIIGNILDNAFEEVLSRPKLNRQVQLFMTDLGNDFIFEIEDSGRGVQHMESIFIKGYSTKSGKDRGIGLHLVQKCVEQLQGNLTVGDSELGGVVFTVSIPKQH
ncbi:histidine kinase [Bacillus sp. AFS015802]|uniref:ATP-binding protein n=1 Tax=Bacillus sp. AFS015802 TaxID=2033486 RepID=UPI000BF34656|nr:sensor histidine kinase [Bacillus sp. AFS015802]PFA63283.1 histidine kinase [Bacillus sp. AFS015802]